ncbi:MAG TPA: hypothetical protein VIU61_29770 [Kofleriaceae bacterium]
MAQSEVTEAAEPGAPIAKDAIDPDLIKLARTRLQIGVLTCLGIVFLCIYFIVRLGPDRRFGGEDERPTTLPAATAMTSETERHVTVEGPLLMAHAMRAGKTHADVGLRLVPVRGTSDRVWIAMSTDVSEKPSEGRYTGRLRDFSSLPFAKALRAQATAHPRAVFATPATIRAAFATGTLTSVTGDKVTVADGDRAAFDLVVPDAAVIIAAINDRMPTPAAWQTALAAAGLPIKLATPHERDATLRQVRFDVATSVAATNTALEAANLWATRAEPVNRHVETTWGELKKSPPTGLRVGDQTLPDTAVPLIGLHVVRGIPGDARVLIVGEHPEDYWYVMPITIALGIIGLLFAWALVRAVRRDLLPPGA